MFTNRTLPDRGGFYTGITTPNIRNKILTVVTEYYDQDDNFRSSDKPEFKGDHSEIEIEREIKFQKSVIEEALKHKIFEEPVGFEYLDCYIEREDRAHDVVILHIQIKVRM
jgi:hypothetical protein